MDRTRTPAGVSPKAEVDAPRCSELATKVVAVVVANEDSLDLCGRFQCCKQARVADRWRDTIIARPEALLALRQC